MARRGGVAAPRAPAASYAAWPGVSTLGHGPYLVRPLVAAKRPAMHRLLGARIAARGNWATTAPAAGSVWTRAVGEVAAHAADLHFLPLCAMLRTTGGAPGSHTRLLPRVREGEQTMPARTGEDYIKGLKEHPREVWIDGERVEDVTTHPALRNGVRSVAALYDMQHDPALREEMTYTSPTTGHPVGLSFLMPQSVG